MASRAAGSVRRRCLVCPFVRPISVRRPPSPCSAPGALGASVPRSERASWLAEGGLYPLQPLADARRGCERT
jgi:hypothetical protein